MAYVDYVIIGLFGLLIGSFLNVLIGRYRELETVVATRSHCPHCRKDIPWYDLVPLLSFVLLRARCRYCDEKISWQYPLVELLTALLAVHLFIVFGWSWLTIAYFAIFALLLAVAVIDSRDLVVPDEYVWPAILLAIIVSALRPYEIDPQTFWGVLLAGGGLAVLVVGSRGRWMGAGDIGLGIILGLLGGFLGSVVGLISAFILGSVVGLVLMAIRRKRLKDMIPFGPFLLVGTYIATIWGQNLAQWYLELVHFY